MAKKDFNTIVIGAGAAGLSCAYIAATVKAKVALIEKHKMGGDCLNTGCVPSKALIRSTKILSYIRRHKEYGIRSAAVDFDFAEIMERIRDVIHKVEPHDSAERYAKLGVECLTGAARIVSPREVSVNGKTLTANSIVIATGARPFIPPIPGLDKIPYLTSDTIWNLRELPKTLAVLGGGPIGCEMAQCFARLGSRVVIVEMLPGLISREDPEFGEALRKRFTEEDIDVRVNTRCKAVETHTGKRILVMEKDGREVQMEFDQILVAVGRKPNSLGFGLENIGVALNPNGTIKVDEYLHATHNNVYACGDVAGPYQLTHAAAHQAWYCAINALFAPFAKFKVSYDALPWCTFTDPEVAHVGLNELDAKTKGIAYEVTRYGIDDLDRAIADSEDHGEIKVLTVPGKDKILGVTIMGYHAGDMIAEYVSAMRHGIGLNGILGTIHAYPSMAEANKYAAGAWKKAHAPQALLKLIQKFHAWRR